MYSNTWTAENQKERLFFNETAFLFWCHALWKLGSSNCCILEMKHVTGMETCIKIYFIYLFSLHHHHHHHISIVFPPPPPPPPPHFYCFPSTTTTATCLLFSLHHHHHHRHISIIFPPPPPPPLPHFYCFLSTTTATLILFSLLFLLLLISIVFPPSLTF